MKRRRLLALLPALALGLVLTACGGGNDNGNGGNADGGGSGETTTFTLAHASPEDTVTGLLSDRFAELVNEKSDGSMVVEVFPNSQLGGDSEIITNLGARQVDFMVATTAPQVGTIPSLALFDLPNAFETEEIARTVFEDNEFMDVIRGEYEEAGLRLLGFADQSYRVMSSNTRVENFSDFSGILIRTLENRFHMAYWEALGASPTPMPFAEVYVGLQQGTVTAQENPYEVIVANSFYEVQDYVINTNHLLHIIALVANNEAFNELPEDQQQVFLDAAAEVIPWAREQADARVQDRIDIIEGAGVEVLDVSPALREEILNAIGPVNELIRSEVGDDLYNQFRDAIERAS